VLVVVDATTGNVKQSDDLTISFTATMEDVDGQWLVQDLDGWDPRALSGGSGSEDSGSGSASPSDGSSSASPDAGGNASGATDCAADEARSDAGQTVGHTPVGRPAGRGA
jgi:hypothetical protein